MIPRTFPNITVTGLSTSIPTSLHTFTPAALATTTPPFPAGKIVGGIIAGAIVISMLVIFAYYKVKCRLPSIDDIEVQKSNNATEEELHESRKNKRHEVVSMQSLSAEFAVQFETPVAEV